MYKNIVYWNLISKKWKFLMFLIHRTCHWIIISRKIFDGVIMFLLPQSKKLSSKSIKRKDAISNRKNESLILFLGCVHVFILTKKVKSLTFLYSYSYLFRYRLTNHWNIYRIGFFSCEAVFFFFNGLKRKLNIIRQQETIYLK